MSYLVRLLNARGITQSELASKMGVSRQSVYAWCKGALPRSPLAISKLAEVLGVPSEDLIHSKETSELPKGDYIDVPYLSVEASCGTGDFALSAVPEISRLRVSREWLRNHAPSANMAHIQIITADGDSMSPTICNGDLLLVDASKKEVTTDAIYAFTLNGCTYVKRLQRVAKGLLVLSDNQAYKPFEISEADTLTVHGRICCKAHFENL